MLLVVGSLPKLLDSGVFPFLCGLEGRMMRIGPAGEGMSATPPARMRGPDMHVVAKRVVKVIRKR